MTRGGVLALALGALACATAPPRAQAPPELAPRAAASANAGATAQPDAAQPAPDSPELTFLTAQRLEQEDQLDAAYAAYGVLLAKDPDDVFLRTRLAQLAFRLGRSGEAQAHAERALALGATDPWLRSFLAQLHLEAGEFAEAAGVLSDAHGDPADGEAAAQLYRLYAQRGALEDARRIARWQVAKEPDVPASWLDLADATAKLGDAAGAEQVLREADRKIRGEPQFLAAIAGLRRGHGDRHGELGVLGELLKRFPKDGASWLAKAEAEFDLGRDAEGRRSLAQAEANQPDDVRTTIRIALLDMQRGAYGEAEKRLARVADQYPEQYEVAYFLGVARRRAGDVEGALIAFDRIPEDHARFADGRTQVAGMLEANGDFAAAQSEIERAQASHNERPLAYYHASLRAKGGDVAGGIAELEAMLGAGADDAETLYQIGVVRGEARDTGGAQAAMERALALDPNHAGALNFLGYTLAERGERLDEAQGLIERALTQRPDDGFVTDSLGWVFYQRALAARAAGDRPAAARWFAQAQGKLERAHTLTGGDPVVSEHLGDVYLALGEKQRALAKYQQALAQTPRASASDALAAKLERVRRELGAK